MSEFDRTVDVLIIGAGAAGLVASLAAIEDGLTTLVVEKGDKIGGSSSYPGGALWIPNNPVNQAAGVADSFDEAMAYMEAVIEDVGPASSRARKEAYLRHGPEMVGFLQRLGFEWRYDQGYSDYYPDEPGGKAVGRGIEAKVFDIKRLGDWRQHLLMNPNVPPIPLYGNEVGSFALFAKTLAGFFTAARVVGGRMIGRMLLGQKPMTNGRALVGRLLLLNIQRKAPIWREARLLELIVEDDAVVGAVVAHTGRKIRIRATRGVLLSAGGFSHNAEMRARYQPAPSSTAWTSTPPGDTGDAVRAGMAVGAATALMDEAWWGPTLVDPATGKPTFILWERSFPHSIIVDSSGQRFMNESESYIDAGHHQYQRNARVPAIPAWLIVDARHRNRYPMTSILPGFTPRSAMDSGFITKATTLAQLASKIDVDAAGLASTVERFNRFARNGIDEDFDRGRTAYDHVYGDPSSTPNPNLGTLEKAPFYAVQVWPGDLGTKGGLLTDEYARVLRDDGRPISGLYATGNTTASVMGRTYPGPGATLGPATTFAYIAMKHLAADASRTSQLAELDRAQDMMVQP